MTIFHLLPTANEMSNNWKSLARGHHFERFRFAYVRFGVRYSLPMYFPHSKRCYAISFNANTVMMSYTQTPGIRMIQQNGFCFSYLIHY